LTELSQHEADRGEAQERQGLSVEALPILGQAAAAVEPRDGAFDDPSLGQDRKDLCDIGALDDLQVDLPEDFAKGRLKDRPLIAAVGIELQGRGAASLEYRLGCGASCLDLLARIIAMRVNPRPPFSALLTL
jgi:hypothetical protein